MSIHSRASPTSSVKSCKNAVSLLFPARAAFLERLIFATIDSSKNLTSGSSGSSMRSRMKASKSCVRSIWSMNALLLLVSNRDSMKSVLKNLRLRMKSRYRTKRDTKNRKNAARISVSLYPRGFGDESCRYNCEKLVHINNEARGENNRTSAWLKTPSTSGCQSDALSREALLALRRKRNCTNFTFCGSFETSLDFSCS